MTRGGAPSPSGRVFRRLGGLAFEATPQVFAVACAILGVTMLISAATPDLGERLQVLARFYPPLLIDLSHFAASIAGFVLLMVSAGLWRRRRGAYYAALAGLVIGAVFTGLQGWTWTGGVELAVAAALLAPCRAAFTRRSRLGEPLRPGWLMLVLAGATAMLWLGFFAYRDTAYADELWWTFLSDKQASGFLRAGAVVAMLTLVVTIRSLLTAPGSRSHGPASPAEVERARQALATAETATPEARLALLGDKALLFSPSGRSFIAYRVRGRRWIAMGEPAGLAAERLPLLWSFAELADSFGGAAVFYSVGEGMLADLATLGLAVRKVGEAAVIDTAAFSLAGRGKQGLRTAVNRAEREGVGFEVLPPGAARPLEAELRRVSDAWLGRHNGEEKAFSLGRFDIAYLDASPLAVARVEGRIVAFANLLTGTGDGGRGEAGGGEVMIDLMRHDPDGPHGIMDFLFTRTALWARDQGLARFDLGMAPLSGLEDRRLAPVFARVGALVFEEGGAVYGFQGLRTYKAKFDPVWRAKFIAAPPSTPLALALLDVALLTSGGWLGLLGLRK